MGSLLRQPPPRIASRSRNRQPFEQREACCTSRRRESLRAGRINSLFEQREACCADRRRESLRAGKTGSLLNNGKPAAPAAAVNRFVQPKPEAPPGRH